MFITDDARGLYDTLKSRGVTDFTQEPTEHFYGTDMGLRDPFGNPIRPSSRGRRPRRRPPEPRSIAVDPLDEALISRYETPHLPRLIGKAGEAGTGADARSLGGCRGQTVDHGLQPRCLHARPTG